MRKLAIHIVGTGAVGLSYGHLLTSQGHDVVHTSVRGIRIERLLVHARIAGETTHSTYTPRYHRFGADTAADVNIFAVPPAACLRYLNATGDEGAFHPRSTNLLFASAFDVDRSFILLPVFPLISCEYCPDDGLSVVTDMKVEVFSPRDLGTRGQSLIRASLDDIGLQVSEYVFSERFRARYVQTAAVYVVLLALSIGLIAHRNADATLLLQVFKELLEMTTAAYPGLQLDFPDSPHASLALVSSLIALSKRRSSENILLRNLHCLLSSNRKLSGHLTPLKALWARHISTLAPCEAPGRDLITAVFSRC